MRLENRQRDWEDRKHENRIDSIQRQLPMRSHDRHRGDQPANQAVWWITHTFFASKFITLFSAMFGAGIILMLGTGDAAHRRHWRRMGWLFMFGMLHASAMHP